MAGAVLAGLLALLSATTVAGAATPTPPFAQCPHVGRDAGCGTLIVVNEGGSLEAFNDPRQGPFGDTDDMLVAAQNNSDAPVKSISISSTSTAGFPSLFNFDSDGICSGVHAPAPAGCPFGPTGYEGPGVEIETTPENRLEGKIIFAGAGLAPGASTYWSFEGIDADGLSEFACGPETGGEVCHTLEPTALTGTLATHKQFAEKLVVRQGTAVTDQATLSGGDVSDASGTLEYELYSNPQCTDLVTTAGTVSFSGGAIPPSSVEALAPGTYYWRTTYFGDAKNAGAQSPCGSTVEFVHQECTAAEGFGHLGPPGAEGIDEHNQLGLQWIAVRFYDREARPRSAPGWAEEGVLHRPPQVQGIRSRDGQRSGGMLARVRGWSHP